MDRASFGVWLSGQGGLVKVRLQLAGGQVVEGVFKGIQMNGLGEGTITLLNLAARRGQPDDVHINLGSVVGAEVDGQTYTF